MLANPFVGVRTYRTYGTVSGWRVSQEAFVQCVLDPFIHLFRMKAGVERFSSGSDHFYTCKKAEILATEHGFPTLRIMKYAIPSHM